MFEKLICIADNILSGHLEGTESLAFWFSSVLEYDAYLVKIMQEPTLKNKMRIAMRFEKLVTTSKKRLSFYMKYAAFVLETLNRPLFQKFLRWMIRKENIEDDLVKTVQVMVFPFQKDNGNGLAGRCNSEGEIFIYPKRLVFFRRIMRNYKTQKVRFYIKSRAMAALIHELLHLKYSEEKRVRELTKKYFNVFIKHQKTQDFDTLSVTEMLFSY